MMRVAGLILAALFVAAPAAADAADKKYSIDLSKTTKAVKPGEKGMFYMHIKPAEGFKVSKEAPLKIALTSAALELHKKKLSVKDVKDAKASGTEFGVKFAAPKEGDTSIEVDAMFFVCDENICERKKEKLSVPVSVRN
jgi:uncharacterized membrane protein